MTGVRELRQDSSHRARPGCRPAGSRSCSPACLVLLFLLALLLPAGLLHAQVPDSTQAAPDSMQVAPDSVRIAPDTTARPSLPTVTWHLADRGIPVVDSMLALSFEEEATGVLAALPGSFVYDLGPVGWPNGWSPYGLNPQRVTLLLNGRPFDDLITGRPRYDLLPFAALEPLHVQPGRQGRAMAAYAQVRPYDIRQPLTELSYRSGATGLKRILAIHTQQRPLALFKQPGILGFVFGYGGHAASGEYDGSRLRRMRQLLLRAHYQQARWSAELTYFHNQRRLGAHSGVIPGTPFETVYNRLIATVRNPGATRQTIRNDLALTVHLRLLPRLAEPFVISAYLTGQRFRYRNPQADTLRTTSNRYGLRLHQDARAGRHRLRFLLEGWTDRVNQHNTFAASGTLARSEFHATVRDSFQVGGLATVAEGGMHLTPYATFAGGAVTVAHRLGPLRLFAEALVAGQPVSRIEEYGFGRFARPVEAVPNGRLAQGRVGGMLRAGPFDLTVYGFAHRITDPLDLYGTAQEDSVEARVADTPFKRIGVGGDLGWRRHTRRGFYLVAQPTLVHFLNPDASIEHRRAKDALPSFFASGRLGARLALFRNDLLLDASLRGRFWTEMRSRTLHAPTGLLVLPSPEADLFPATGFLPASGVLDAVLEARIRTATLFLAYDNVLSGTQVLIGNMIVPTYPLPEQRLRFGIFWPIAN